MISQLNQELEYKSNKYIYTLLLKSLCLLAHKQHLILARAHPSQAPAPGTCTSYLNPAAPPKIGQASTQSTTSTSTSASSSNSSKSTSPTAASLFNLATYTTRTISRIYTWSRANHSTSLFQCPTSKRARNGSTTPSLCLRLDPPLSVFPQSPPISPSNLQQEKLKLTDPISLIS